jgi:diguanylate cyclase (GGDEF)-like protein
VPRILAVGDEAWCATLSSALEAAGYEVASTQDALDAARIALRAPLSGIVTQLVLDGPSGLQLCRLLQTERAVAEVPFILMSAELGAGFKARAAGAAAHVHDLDGLLALLPTVVARPPAPAAFPVVDRAGLVRRLSEVLDQALLDGELAAEVRALATAAGLETMFDDLVALASQVLCYRWLALVVSGECPRFLLHADKEDTAAEGEARAALGVEDALACTRTERAVASAVMSAEPVEVPIFFGDSQVGQLAVALPIGHGREAKRAVGLVAYELGGPLQIQALLEQVRRQAATDTLTGMMNRRAFLDAAAREQARSTRHGYPFSVFVVDIDFFKYVNDTHGHPAGDAVLKALARTLSATSRAADISCRWGGEEFVVALPQTDGVGALLAAERFRLAIERMRVTLPSGVTLQLTASIGVATAASPWSIEPLLAAADAALYAAKLAGRNRVRLGPEKDLNPAAPPPPRSSATDRAASGGS